VSTTIEKLIANDESSSSGSQNQGVKKQQPNKKEEAKNPEYYYDSAIKQWIINGKPPEDDSEEIKKAQAEKALAPPPMMLKKDSNAAPQNTEPKLPPSEYGQEAQEIFTPSPQFQPPTTKENLNTPFQTNFQHAPKTVDSNIARKLPQKRYVSNFN